MKTLFLLAGIAAVAAGLLFAGQGLGYIRWPASSFMISQVRWAYYGAGIAAVGLALIVIVKR
jgi:bacteriorhodopsin